MRYLTSYYWEKGNYRENNEDSFTMQRVRAGGSEIMLLAVCDGIGGLPDGETASGFVAERLTEWFYREGIRLMSRIAWTGKTARGAVKALRMIQESVERYEREEKMCCGTTCTAAFVKNGRLLLMHTGDSRAYLIGKKEYRLTADHGEGRTLNRCVGGFGFRQPDLWTGKLRRGEQLLICTDGFCRRAPEGFFRGSLSAGPDKPGEWFRRLKGIGFFMTAQGEKDNMTALLLKNCKRRRLFEK